MQPKDLKGCYNTTEMTGLQLSCEINNAAIPCKCRCKIFHMLGLCLGGGWHRFSPSRCAVCGRVGQTPRT
uniref:Uncharacterized protein n=1 Tax=Anguilla anguilla TaxID=7936 RepID=A0A0E9W4U8_ANGAN